MKTNFLFHHLRDCGTSEPPPEGLPRTPSRRRAAGWLPGICGAAWLLAGNLGAQPFSLDWHSIDGGGGTSTGGVYVVCGVIGQPDAGRLTGGNFAVEGGFWSSLATVQTPGAPMRTISLTVTNTAMISWPSSATGFRLQQNTNGLGTVNWSNAPEATDNGTNKYLIANPPSGSRFYRLSKP